MIDPTVNPSPSCRVSDTLDRLDTNTGSPSTYTGDRGAFMNIITNAIDAIDGAGEISIATAAGNGVISVTVQDSGRGIPEENIERIFDPFFTTRDVGEGSGLGLAICHGIVRKHGGEITACSSIGSASSFTLTLPLA